MLLSHPDHREPVILYVGQVGGVTWVGHLGNYISILAWYDSAIRGSCLSLSLIGDHIWAAISPFVLCGILPRYCCLGALLPELHGSFVRGIYFCYEFSLPNKKDENIP